LEEAEKLLEVTHPQTKGNLYWAPNVVFIFLIT
jgi:hypothetical protein